MERVVMPGLLSFVVTIKLQYFILFEENPFAHFQPALFDDENQSTFH